VIKKKTKTFANNLLNAERSEVRQKETHNSKPGWLRRGRVLYIPSTLPSAKCKILLDNFKLRSETLF
jgi:hypothetical protein